MVRADRPLSICIVVAQIKGDLHEELGCGVLLTTFLLAACATANKISGVQLGMTKDEVFRVMGNPISVSAQAGLEYLNYVLSEPHDDAFRGWTTAYYVRPVKTTPYYVRLVKGKVESYGRTGDFDSTKTPTVRLESDHTIGL